MISDPCLAALRMAAVLAYRLPLRLRVVGGGEPIIDVSRPPCQPEAHTRWLPPCAFRAAVIEAWRMHQEGRQLQFCGLDDDAEVSVDVGVPPGGKACPGGIYHVPWGTETLVAFATGSDAGLCRDLAGSLGVSVHEDGALDVGLLHLAAPVEDTEMAHELIVTALARLTAEEMVAAAAPGRAGRID